MKKVMYMIVVYCCLFTLSATDDIYAIKPASFSEYPIITVDFLESKGIEYNNYDSGEHKTGTYEIDNQKGVLFLQVQWKDNSSDRFLAVMNNNICLLYKSDGYPFFRGFKRGGGAPGEACFTYTDANAGIYASSLLTENGTTYGPENMNEDIGTCWVEGVKGQGIHEKILIRTGGARSLHVSTGFVSYEKPELFSQNSRPKVIRLYADGTFDFNIELRDYSQIHTITLPKAVPKDQLLTIEILEVYPGTHYQDTCINMIMVDGVVYE